MLAIELYHFPTGAAGVCLRAEAFKHRPSLQSAPLPGPYPHLHPGFPLTVAW